MMEHAHDTVEVGVVHASGGYEQSEGSASDHPQQGGPSLPMRSVEGGSGAGRGETERTAISTPRDTDVSSLMQPVELVLRLPMTTVARAVAADLQALNMPGNFLQPSHNPSVLVVDCDTSASAFPSDLI